MLHKLPFDDDGLLRPHSDGPIEEVAEAEVVVVVVTVGMAATPVDLDRVTSVTLSILIEDHFTVVHLSFNLQTLVNISLLLQRDTHKGMVLFYINTLVPYNDQPQMILRFDVEQAPVTFASA